jgi:excisionase family DNA binding protein
MDNQNTTLPLPDRLLTAVEVAKVLNVSRAFAYQLMRQGKIRTVFIAGARRVRPEDLYQFIQSNLSPQNELASR